MDEHTPLYTSDLPDAEALIVRKQNALAPSRGAIATLAGFSASLLVAGAYFASSSGSFVGGTFESRHRLGDEPPHSAIAVDQIVGPLTADVRNAARLGQLKTSELATPNARRRAVWTVLKGCWIVRSASPSARNPSPSASTPSATRSSARNTTPSWRTFVPTASATKSMSLA